MDNRDGRYDRTAAELRRRRRAREVREKRRKALFKRRAMIVGGGVLAVALVVGLIVLVVNLISSGSKPQVTATVAPTSASLSQNATLPGNTTGDQTSDNTGIVNGNGSSNGYNSVNNGFGNGNNNGNNNGLNGDNYGGETADDNGGNIEYNTVAPYEEGQQNAGTYSQTADQGDNASGNAAQSGQSGNQLHYYANGKTSYGWDWTYAGGDGLVDVACNYNTSTNQYDFVITGKQPGSGSVTLIYNTDDTRTASQTVSFTVDNNLNISGN